MRLNEIEFSNFCFSDGFTDNNIFSRTWTTSYKDCSELATVYFFIQSHAFTNIVHQFFCMFIGYMSWNTLAEAGEIFILSMFTHLGTRHTFGTFSIRITVSSRYHINLFKMIMSVASFNAIIFVQ